MRSLGSALFEVRGWKLGRAPKASSLVDLRHHAPNVNIEKIVARLIAAGKLGRFHFNDSNKRRADGGAHPA
jgi:L-rhamnose isomerase